MKLLNLGCGVKVSARPEVINIDWSIYLRINQNRLLRTIVPRLVKGQRRDRFRKLSDNIMVHNLAKRLPFESDSIDVVYHSHLLEHLDRNVAKLFLLEVKRVLKPGGIQRIVVPDLEKACRDYLTHISKCEDDREEAGKHDSYVATIIEQCVRKEAYATSQLPPIKRFAENALLGDARRRGETHQWMYDRVNLSALLVSLGFKKPVRQNYFSSMVPNWCQYGLEVDEYGHEYKPGSLYLEVEK